MDESRPLHPRTTLDTEDSFPTSTQAGDYLALLDRKGSILRSSGVFAGFESRDLAGTSLLEYLNPDSKELLERFLGKSRESEHSVALTAIDRNACEVRYTCRFLTTRQAKGPPAQIIFMARGAGQSNTEHQGPARIDLKESLLENLPNGVLLQSDGIIAYANGACVQLLGARDAGEIQGLSILSIIHPEHREMVRERINRLSVYGGRAKPVEEKFLTLDGRIISAEVTSFRINDVPGVTIQEVLRDMTRSKQVEHERVDLLQQERRARSEAEASLSRLRSIHEVTEAALAYLALEDLLTVLLNRVAVILSGDLAAVLLLTDDGKHIQVRAAIGASRAQEPGVRMPIGRGIEGRIAARRAPVIRNHIRTATPPGARFRFGARSLIGVPLVVEGNVIGVLEVGSTKTRVFSGEDLEFLQIVADRVAPAIDRARLLECVQDSRRSLQELSQRLLDLQEAERRAIARELHDEIGQILTGLSFVLNRSQTALSTSVLLEAPERASLELEIGNARELVNDLLSRVRTISMTLRPAILDDLGLVPALLWLFERYHVQFGIQVGFRHPRISARLPQAVETAAFRIVQEALTNVARHADVKTVTVNLSSTSEVIHIRVEDRGKGFSMQGARGASTGLAGMRERARLLKGRLLIESSPGGGTRVEARLPINVIPGLEVKP